jgi:SAM-dependent methyltransferase
VSFDPIAPWYRTLERIAFGDALQRCRVACLGEIITPRRALIVGEGDGRFLCELLQRYPDIEVDCIDASRRMLQLARKRVEDAFGNRGERVYFSHEDITSWSPPENRYDLVVTHFFLDCFAERELAAVVRKLAQATTREAAWLLADFCIPERGFARFRARVWLAFMYRFFRLTTRIDAMKLMDPTALIRGEGFTLYRQRTFQQGMLMSALWRISPSSRSHRR